MATIGALAALALAPAGDAAPNRKGQAARPAPRPAALEVEMTGFRSDRGTALVALFASAKGFPDEAERAVRRISVPIRNRRARATFRRLPPGTYAVGVLHDEDGNRKMKTNLVGMPKEGYGASRDARGKMGPPKFDDARLALRTGQTLKARIRLVYH